MKKLFLLAMIALASVGINAQTVKGEGSLMGNIGYQTNYERFGLGVQGRYAIANNLRMDRSNSTKFAFNLGGGITLPISERSYLNAEARFMFAKDDNVAIMLGYGYRF